MPLCASFRRSVEGSVACGAAGLETELHRGLRCVAGVILWFHALGKFSLCAAPAANLLLPLSNSCDGISSFLGSLHAFRGPVEGPVARIASGTQSVRVPTQMIASYF